MLAGTQKPMLGMKLNRAHLLANSLVGCLLFNEGIGNMAYDTSGYGNHGTLTNMAFPATTASGWNPDKSGSALNFDGINNYVNCGNDLSLNITDRITIEAWVYRNEATVDPVIVKRNGVTNYQMYLDGDNTLKWYDTTNGGLDSSIIVGIGAWHHILITWDGTDMYFYVDGVSTYNTPVASLPSSTDSFAIGTDKHGSYFNGTIDNVKIYNRALSTEEVKCVYRAPYCMFERGELLL